MSECVACGQNLPETVDVNKPLHVIRALSDHYKVAFNPTDSDDVWDKLYEDVFPNRPFFVDRLGTVTKIDEKTRDFDYEGYESQSVFMIFKIESEVHPEVFYRITGTYRSYTGTEWDSNTSFKKVTSRTETVTVWD